jgi:hypothetical protein
MSFVTVLGMVACAPSKENPNIPAEPDSSADASIDTSFSTQAVVFGQQLSAIDGGDGSTWVPLYECFDSGGADGTGGCIQEGMMSDADLAPGYIGEPCPDVPCPSDRPACLKAPLLTWGEVVGPRCCIEVSVQQPPFTITAEMDGETIEAEAGGQGLGFIDCVLASTVTDQ